MCVHAFDLFLSIYFFTIIHIHNTVSNLIWGDMWLRVGGWTVASKVHHHQRGGKPSGFPQVREPFYSKVTMPLPALEAKMKTSPNPQNA